jgi:hypothetical protein
MGRPLNPILCRAPSGRFRAPRHPEAQGQFAPFIAPHPRVPHACLRRAGCGIVRPPWAQQRLHHARHLRPYDSRPGRGSGPQMGAVTAAESPDAPAKNRELAAQHLRLVAAPSGVRRLHEFADCAGRLVGSNGKWPSSIGTGSRRGEAKPAIAVSGDDLHRVVTMSATHAVGIEVFAIDCEDSPRAQGFCCGNERCVRQVHWMISV